MKPSDLIIVMVSSLPYIFLKSAQKRLKDHLSKKKKNSRIQNRTDHEQNFPSADANIILNHQIIVHLSPFYPKKK